MTKKENIPMRKHATLLLASAAVALSASGAFAMPGPMYPGDHLVDYDPVNQAYEWRLNNDGGSTVQPGYNAYAAAKRQHVVTTRSFDQIDPWQKARIDDESEARGD
jgi:hypothetical protein